jgi:muramoyltetrapeptide carboxypeptidase
VIGYSDITALLLALQRGAGLVASTARGDLRPSADTRWRWRGADAPTARVPVLAMADQNLRAPRPRRLPHAHAARRCAEGRLVGGNLSVLTRTGRHAVRADFERALLFLEEIGEEPYRIDRMLTQLQQSQGLHACRGLMCGVFERLRARGRARR